MGGSTFHKSDYDARSTVRKDTATPVMAYTASIASGKTKAEVHSSLNPFNVKLRESRDSDTHPEVVPIAILLDTTGSMQRVPEMIEAKLPTLMSHFLEDKASGKKYLGDGYPAILIAAVDDYAAMRGPRHDGTLQVGQFESGMEIDQMIENLWLTSNGGGSYEESYELGLYFMARHTAHDHMDKRGRKGYLFIIGDEHAYPEVTKAEISTVIGDIVQDDIPLETILAEAKELYNIFFIIPAMTLHFTDRELEKWWVKHLSQQNVLKLDDPNQICALIASAVAISENHVGLADVVADGVMPGKDAGILSKLADTVPVKRDHSAAGLAKLNGTKPASKASIERL